jgi:hypothetical protein
MQQSVEIYKGPKFPNSSNNRNAKGDTSAVVSFYPDRREFDLSVFPDTIIHYDTIQVDDGPIIVKGDTTWEKVIWIVGTLVINIVVFFVGKKSK